jgi:hypothetical protein
MTRNSERRPLTQTEIRQHMRQNPRWLPTPEEIQAACLEIQSEWDDETIRHRLGIRTEHPAKGFGHTAGLKHGRLRGVSTEQRKRLGE